MSVCIVCVFVCKDCVLYFGIIFCALCQYRLHLVLSYQSLTPCPAALLQLMKIPTIILSLVLSISSKFNTLFNYSIMENVLLNLTSEFKPSLLRHILACLRWSYFWHLSTHCHMHTSVWLHTIFISFSMYT